MKSRRLFLTAAMFSVIASAPGSLWGQASDNDSDDNGASTSTTVTNATGTITQLNYDTNGGIEEFLVGTNILLSFPNEMTGGISSLGAVGNSVTYSGTAITNSSGFQVVRISTFTNNTTKATYSSTTSTSTAYGPTSGTVKQLNYGPDGSIDGFVFTPNGGTTSLLVVTGSNASATLKPLLTVGATVSVTGTHFGNSAFAACTATGALGVVNASSLIVGGQTIVIAGGNSDSRGPHGHR